MIRGIIKRLGQKPPGYESCVRRMKREPRIDNPYAFCHWWIQQHGPFARGNELGRAGEQTIILMRTGVLFRGFDRASGLLKWKRSTRP